MTDDDKQKLHKDYPLWVLTKEILGLSPDSPLHSFEDRNTSSPSPWGDEADEKVDGQLSIKGVGEMPL